MYNDIILKHFQRPQNVGEMDNATAVVEVTNPACGDILKLWIQEVDGRVVDVKFKVSGCVPSIACGSVLTEMIKGQPISKLNQITPVQIEEAVEGLPTTSRHAAQLAADALKAIVKK